MNTKTLCPAGCGKKFNSKEHAEQHANIEHPDWKNPKRKGWPTPYGFVDFREPVTYETACATAQKLQEKFCDKK